MFDRIESRRALMRLSFSVDSAVSFSVIASALTALP
jgi:hypothetical protein